MFVDMLLQWQIQDSPKGGFVFLPKKSNDLFLLVNLFIILRFLCPQILMPFLGITPSGGGSSFSSYMPKKPPNSAPYLQQLLQKNFFVSGGVRTHPTNPLDPHLC